MKAIEFKGQNITFAENQPEYEKLPGKLTKEGVATFCFELSEDEKKQIAETGHLWISVLTFYQPLQPIRLSVLKPDEIE